MKKTIITLLLLLLPATTYAQFDPIYMEDLLASSTCVTITGATTTERSCQFIYGTTTNYVADAVERLNRDFAYLAMFLTFVIVFHLSIHLIRYFRRNDA